MTYAVQADVEYILSELGVELRLDDDASGSLGSSESASLTFALEEADAQANLYLRQRYTAAVLDASDYVKKACANIAACLLCRRRGVPSPEALERWCQRYLDQFEKIAEGDLVLPEATLKDDPGPIVTNHVVDDRFANVKTRSSRLRSTGDAPPSPLKNWPAVEFRDVY